MMDARAIDDLLPYRMNRLLAVLNRNLSERLRGGGYTFQDWRIVAILESRPGIGINALAEAAVLPQATASRLVMQLEAAGLVVRSGDRDDQRRVTVTLTALGRQAHAEMFRHAVLEYEAAMVGFGDEERAMLIGLIDRMARNMGVSDPADLIVR